MSVSEQRTARGINHDGVAYIRLDDHQARMADLKAEKDEAQLQEHLAKNGESLSLAREQRLSGALKRILDEQQTEGGTGSLLDTNPRFVAMDMMDRIGRIFSVARDALSSVPDGERR